MSRASLKRLPLVVFTTWALLVAVACGASKSKTEREGKMFHRAAVARCLTKSRHPKFEDLIKGYGFVFLHGAPAGELKVVWPNSVQTANLYFDTDLEDAEATEKEMRLQEDVWNRDAPWRQDAVFRVSNVSVMLEQRPRGSQPRTIRRCLR